MKRVGQLWYKCIQLDFIIMIKSIQTMGCDIVDTRMTGSHRERLPLTEDIKAYPVFQLTTGVGDITRVTPQELATSSPKCPSGDVKAWYDTVSSRTDIRTPKNRVGKKRAKKATNIF